MSEDHDWTVPKWITTVEAVEMARRTMEDAERQRAEYAEAIYQSHQCGECREKDSEIERLRGGIQAAVDAFGHAPLSDTWWLADGFTVYEHLRLLAEKGGRGT